MIAKNKLAIRIIHPTIDSTSMIMASRQDKFWKVSILHNIERNHHSHFRLQKPCQRKHIKPMAMVVLQLYALVAKRCVLALLCSLSSLLFWSRGLNNYGLWCSMGHVKLIMENAFIHHGPFDMCHLRLQRRNHSLCQTRVKFYHLWYKIWITIWQVLDDNV